MPARNSSQKRSIFGKRKYWYHVSSTLKNSEEKLVPWGNDKGFNRTPDEPDTPRICVAPTIEHCFVAIPYNAGTTYSIYRSKSPVKARTPEGVWDAGITQERWITKPTTFRRIGSLDMSAVSDSCSNYYTESCTRGNVDRSRSTLRWWKKIGAKNFIKRD